MNSSSALQKTLVSGLLLLVSVGAHAQFKGGIDDGTQMGQSNNQPLGDNIFRGGSDDGTSLGLAVAQPIGQPIFRGGSDDGTSLGLAATQALGRSISLGGSDDGWAIAFKSKDSVPLPVTLTEFTARWQQSDALLRWKTASEVNTSHFELERSLDGTTFTRIQRVTTAGQSSSLKNYQYLDVNIGLLLPTGITAIYYRLRSVDVGGAASFSGVVVLQASHSGGNAVEYAVFPVPAREVVTITARQLPAAGGATIRLLDGSGRVVVLQKMVSSPQQLSVSALVEGVYFLQLIAAEKVLYTQRIVVSK